MRVRLMIGGRCSQVCSGIRKPLTMRQTAFPSAAITSALRG
jgi:hypothetical protein